MRIYYILGFAGVLGMVLFAQSGLYKSHSSNAWVHTVKSTWMDMRLPAASSNVDQKELSLEARLKAAIQREDWAEAADLQQQKNHETKLMIVNGTTSSAILNGSVNAASFVLKEEAAGLRLPPPSPPRKNTAAKVIEVSNKEHDEVVTTAAIETSGFSCQDAGRGIKR